MLKIELKNRELTSEAKDILMAYFVGEIEQAEAHNKLIVLGFDLTEDDRVIDY